MQKLGGESAVFCVVGEGGIFKGVDDEADIIPEGAIEPIFDFVLGSN